MVLDPNILRKQLAMAKGRGNEFAIEFIKWMESIEGVAMPSAAPYLEALFNYNGKPVTLDDHFCFESLFDYNAPSTITLMCSRQVGKSMQMTMRALQRAAWLPHWNILVVAPYFETIRRLSTDYFASLINQSPCRSLFVDRDCVKQVLERSLPNHSRIRFTYAYRSADRARGIHAREMILDEFQMMLPEVIPVLKHVMGASPYGNIITQAGTPLTNSNHLSVEFKEESSRSHWMIPCRSCRKENIAALEEDMLGMIGRPHNNISFDRPGIKCANEKCGYPLFPWDGMFVHFNEKKRESHLGLHVPGMILPFHCCNPVKWAELYALINNPRTPLYTKYNEAFGVPYDDGVMLLTQTDMERTATLNNNDLREVIPILERYSGRIVLGVDWGGGGLSGLSLTKVAVCGLNHDGKLHVLFGLQFNSTASDQEQSEVIHYIWRHTQAQYLAHDNLGIGSKCERMLVEKGIPIEKIIPMEYTGETQGQIMRARKASEDRPRPALSVDKTRGLLNLVEAFRCGEIKTFRFNKQGHGAELLLDLTHLRAEEKAAVASVKSETVLISKEAGSSDDFAHAIHFAANLLWSTYNAWPRLSYRIELPNSPQDLAAWVNTLSLNVDPVTLYALGLTTEDLEDVQDLSEADPYAQGV